MLKESIKTQVRSYGKLLGLEAARRELLEETGYGGMVFQVEEIEWPEGAKRCSKIVRVEAII